MKMAKKEVFFCLYKCQHWLITLKRKIVIAASYNSPTHKEYPILGEKIILYREWQQLNNRIHLECKHTLGLLF